VQQKLVIRKELVKVKGNYKVIIIKKEDFFKVLKRVKLRILNKEYEVLMPPLDDMLKNTIDVNGLAILLSQYLSALISNSGNQSSTTPAQMVLTTSNGTVTLTYTGGVRTNTKGVSVYLQIFENNNNFVFQFYFVGFDTTDDSYTTSQIELYASAYTVGSNPAPPPVDIYWYTDIIRIAYSNTSFTKTSDSYLFIVWLIQFQNVPPYAVLFIPIFQNNIGIAVGDFPDSISSYTVYFNNNNCNFQCGGNCPSGGLTGFVTSVQGNNIIMEFPVMVGLCGGVSTAEILICSNTLFGFPTNNGFTQSFTISTNFTTTLSPPVSGGTFYLGLATITVIFQTS